MSQTFFLGAKLQIIGKKNSENFGNFRFISANSKRILIIYFFLNHKTYKITKLQIPTWALIWVKAYGQGLYPTT
jgi:hypothetical protein